MTSWSLEPIFNTTLGMVLIAVVLASLLAFGPRFGRLPANRRGILSALRALVILLVLLAMLRPTHVFTSTKPRSAVVIVLADASRSMELADRIGGASRWQAQAQALNAAAPILAQMEHAEVRYYAYDSSMHLLESASGSVKLPEKPSGQQTDIGSALDEALRREVGKRIAAVILLGDGTQTAFSSPIESQAAARRLRDEFGAPLYTTAFGPAGDASQAKDVAIERLDEQYTVFVKNEVVIRGRMKIAGYSNQQVPVELKITDVAGKEQIVGRIARVAKQDGELIEFAFPYTPQQVGHFKVTVKAAEQPGELVIKNNELCAYLTVLDGGLRVLLIDSGKRPEFKFLRRALNDSPDIELDDLVIDATNRASWPVNLSGLLKDPKFDVYILGNVPAQALGEENLTQLAAQIDKGRGLLAIGGVRTFGAGNYINTPLADVLPITFDRFEKQDFAGPDRSDLFLPGPLAMTPSISHSVTRLGEDSENLAIWKTLPPLDFANKFVGLKAVPGVKPLLTGPGNEPLLVSGEYGGGRVLAFAGESTFRWPMKGFAPQHKRFWRQAILWLSRRDESQHSDVWIKLAQRRFQPGGNVAFTLGAKSPEGDVLTKVEFAANLVGPDGKTQPLRITPAAELWQGNTSAKTPGDYAIEVTATASGRTLGKARAEFLVFDQDIELTSSAADHEHFARLAQITKDVGGRTVAPEELPSLMRELAAKKPEMEIRQIKWRLGDSTMSAWGWLIAFASLLGTEWWLRKKWGLV